MRDKLAQLSQAQLNLSLAQLSLHLDSVGVINAFTGSSSAADVSVIGTWEFCCFPVCPLHLSLISNPSSRITKMFNFPEFHQFIQKISLKAEIVVSSCSSSCPNTVCLVVSGLWFTFFHFLLIYLSSLLKTLRRRSCNSQWGKVRVKVKPRAEWKGKVKCQGQISHRRNSEGQMFESFKTPETQICYTGQLQHSLSDGVLGMSQDITLSFWLSILTSLLNLENRHRQRLADGSECWRDI